MGIVLGGKAGQAGRPAGPKFSSRTLQFSSKMDRFSTKLAKFLVGAAAVSVRSTATQHSPPLAAHRHSRIRSYARNSTLLWWDHSTPSALEKPEHLCNPLKGSPYKYIVICFIYYQTNRIFSFSRQAKSTSIPNRNEIRSKHQYYKNIHSFTSLKILYKFDNW